MSGYEVASPRWSVPDVYGFMQPQSMVAVAERTRGRGSLGETRESDAHRRVQGARYQLRTSCNNANHVTAVAASTGNHGQSAFAGTRGSHNVVVPANPENAAIGLWVRSSSKLAKISMSRWITPRTGEERAPTCLSRTTGTRFWVLAVMRWNCSNAPALDTVYVPLAGLVAGVVAARDALGLSTKIVGVVAELAPAYLHSFQQRQAVTTNACTTFAEGLAVRIPNPEALQMILQGVDRVVAVGDDEIAEAMRQIFSATHNVVEGAGASTFAALMREREHMAGRRVGVVFSGANIDKPRYLQVLEGRTPGQTA